MIPTSIHPPSVPVQGLLMFASDNLKSGMLFICLLLDIEPMPKNSRSMQPLRSVNLVKSAAVPFLEMLGETISIGDYVEVEVCTDDIEQDMASGKGIKGTKTSFKGLSITCIARQCDATPMTSGPPKL
jgi:hypothetical protein